MHWQGMVHHNDNTCVSTQVNMSLMEKQTNKHGRMMMSPVCIKSNIAEPDVWVLIKGIHYDYVLQVNTYTGTCIKQTESNWNDFWNCMYADACVCKPVHCGHRTAKPTVMSKTTKRERLPEWPIWERHLWDGALGSADAISIMGNQDWYWIMISERDWLQMQTTKGLELEWSPLELTILIDSLTK